MISSDIIYDIHWVPKLINQAYFRFFSAILEDRKNVKKLYIEETISYKFMEKKVNYHISQKQNNENTKTAVFQLP